MRRRGGCGISTGRPQQLPPTGVTVEGSTEGQGQGVNDADPLQFISYSTFATSQLIARSIALLSFQQFQAEMTPILGTGVI